MFFFFKQKTAYELRISDWSSDVCSSDLKAPPDRPCTLLGRGDLSSQSHRPPRGIALAPRRLRRLCRLSAVALWTTVQFSQAMVSVVAAISLMVAVALDQIADLRREVDADDLSGLLTRREL